jgi:hypothetical protein
LEILGPRRAVNRPFLAFAGLVAVGATAVGVYLVATGGSEEEVQQVRTATAAVGVTATSTPITPTATPGSHSTASLPGGYQFSYPTSWTQVVVAEDPYIARFFLTPPTDLGSEALADLQVIVYQNPQGLPPEEFFNGQERPNLFKDAVGGYKPFEAGGATGYWFDTVLGFSNSTDVALFSDGFVYQFADPEQNHQTDGVFLQVVSSFKPSGD